MNLKLDDDVVADKESTGGGGNSRIWDAGVYNTKIEMVTVEESKSGATSVNITLKPADPEAKLFPLRETFWITSGKAKGSKPFYVGKDGKKHPLPGYTVANRMCLATVGKPLSEAVPEGEVKTINAFSYEHKKEIPVEKYVLTELIGKPVTVAVMAQERNKRRANAEGVYVDIAETYTANEVRYFANTETGLSVDEMADGTTEASFMKEWHEKNKGVVVDKTNKDLKAAAAPAAKSADKASVFS